MALLLRLLFCLVLLAAALPPAAGAATVKRAPRNDTLAECSWDRPGRNAFTGDVVAAIDRYSDIPTPVRVRLKERMQAREYDDMVDIRRDSIKGKFEYASTIRDMHFGKDRVCRTVTRSKWTAKTHERGMVYCEGEHCILVPTVCRNVSRIDRKPALVAGDVLKPPPGVPPAAALPGDGRESAAGAAAPQAPPAPVASSFSEAVAGAVVPLFGPVGETPLGAGTPPAGAVAAPGAGSSDAFDPGSPPFPPVLFVPGGGGPVFVPGGGAPIVIVPDPGGGGGGGGGGPADPGTPPVTPVPEPATWASLLGGLALLAWVVRRQRRAVVVAGTPKCATQKRS
jgi:PEP-CTERM motif